MDAKELFSKVDLNSWQTVFGQLKQLFFNQKAVEIKDEENEISLIYDYDESKAKAYIKKIKRTLPEAELIEGYFTGFYWVKMKNVDFKINTHCENYFSFYDETLCSATFYEQNGVASLMRKIDAAIPLWMNEFQWFCARNKVQIELLERERLLNRSDKKNIVDNYLKSRISDKLLATRVLIPNMFDSEYKEFKKYCMEDESGSIMLKNISVEEYHFLDISAYSNSYHISMMPYKPEVLVEIDNSIPQWLDEAQTLLREFDKREKIEQLNTNSVKVLIKNKMRELGWEYKFYGNARSWEKPKELVLEVKLQKNRKMVLKIAADNLDKAKKTLEPLAAYAAAINSVPMNCRIRNCKVGGEDWNKEEL